VSDENIELGDAIGAASKEGCSKWQMHTSSPPFSPPSKFREVSILILEAGV